jgi:hypothetical protein
MEADELVNCYPKWKQELWVAKADQRFIQYDPGSTNPSHTVTAYIRGTLLYETKSTPVEDHHADGVVENKIGHHAI